MIGVAVALGAMAVLATTAAAKVIYRAQNPDLVVRVQIWPRHPHVGDTVVARVRIRNVTGHRLLDAQVGDIWRTPTGGQGGAIAGTLGRGILWVDVFRYRVTAKTPRGRFVIEGDAFDRRGESHAALAVTY